MSDISISLAPSSPPCEPSQPMSFQPLVFRELTAQTQPQAEWIWHGYLARGNVTLLTSQWKAGKTTLLSVLLAKLHAGGQLGGLAVQPGRAAVVSEEGPTNWHRRGQRLEFGPHTCFFCRPFPTKPSRDQWGMLIAELVRLRHERGIDLAVIDTLSAVTPSGTENLADNMLGVLRPLEQLTRAGMAVLLMHHPRKGELRAGQAARGTGALSAYADVLIEMRSVARSAPNDRRRRLSAWSRHEETPSELVIELSGDGCDYVACPDAADDELAHGLEILQELLSRSPVQLTRERVLEQWWERPKPSDASVWRWLDRAVSLGLVCQDGTGRRGNPFRYWLRGRDVPWEPSLEEVLGLD